MDWALVSALGALVGIGGIVSRYKDEPGSVLRTWPAILYILLNASVSALALFFAKTFGWNFGIQDAKVLPWAQVFASGFGAMTLLRTSFYTVKVGDQEVQIGPSNLLMSLLNVIDREVDRLRAEVRATTVSRIMEDISFEKAFSPLPAYCFALMQNLSKEDQINFGKAVKSIFDSKMSDHTKALLFGAQLLNLVGEEVLQAAVAGLGKQIQRELPASEEAPSE